MSKYIGVLSIFTFFALVSVASALDLPSVEIRRDPNTGNVTGIVNKEVSTNSDAPVSTLRALPAIQSLDDAAKQSLAFTKADEFLTRYAPIYGIKDVSKELSPSSASEDSAGLFHVRYDQTYFDEKSKQLISVYGKQIVVHLNQKQEVTSTNGKFIENINVYTGAILKPEVVVKRAIKDSERVYKFNRLKSVAKRSARKTCRNKKKNTTAAKVNLCVNKSVKKFIKANGFYSLVKPKLYILNGQFLNVNVNENYLVYKLQIANGEGFVNDHLFLDASSGVVVKRQGDGAHLNRDVWDCSDPTNSDGCNLGTYSSGYNYYFGRKEGQPARGPNPLGVPFRGSLDVDHAYDYAEIAHNYYLVRFGRNGGNGLGGIGNGVNAAHNKTKINTHLNGITAWNNFCSKPNAQYSSGSLNFCSNSATLDVFGHEYGHVVAAFISGGAAWSGPTTSLLFQAEAGYLNESNSDVVGQIFENYVTGSTDWKSGTDLIGGAIRDLTDPPSLVSPTGINFPDNYNSPLYYCPQPGEGVYYQINSTVPSKAAYLASEGGDFNGCQIQGIGINKVEQIWHKALTEYYAPDESFSQAYNSINDACTALAVSGQVFSTGYTTPFTITGADCQEVKKALESVELNLAGGCVNNQPANYDLTPTCAVNPPEYSADFNGDSVVNYLDYQILRGRWSYPNEAQRLLSAPPEADANFDGLVDMLDYNIFVEQFIRDNPGLEPPPPPTMIGDLNLDGVIDSDDFIQWMQTNGQTGPALLADTDVNGVVDNADLQMWASRFPAGNAADYNGDTVVDLGDYDKLRQQWSQTGQGLSADINADGLVGIFDYQVWFYVYNQANAPLAPTIAGDYNLDGQVDAADYVMWRNNYGNTGQAMMADGNADGTVNAADYTIWRNNLGATVEPPALVFYPGDCDFDGDVDGADFLKWQRTLGVGPTELACDFDGDFDVDGDDLNLWRENFGSGA